MVVVLPAVIKSMVPSRSTSAAATQVGPQFEGSMPVICQDEHRGIPVVGADQIHKSIAVDVGSRDTHGRAAHIVGSRKGKISFAVVGQHRQGVVADVCAN